MSSGRPDRDKSGIPRKRGDERERSPSPESREHKPIAPMPLKLVLSLADGPEALNRAFLRMRRVSAHGHG